MKSIFRNLVLAALLFTAGAARSQNVITYYVPMDSCIMLSDVDWNLDSFEMITNADFGTVNVSPAGVMYCPDQGFVGVDSFHANVCAGFLYPCGTYIVVIYVDSSSGCNIGVYIQPAMQACPGASPSYEAVVWGGSGTISYQWSDGTTGPFICADVPGIYCVSVTDANGCVADACINTQNNDCMFFANQISSTPQLNVVMFTAVTDPVNPPVSYLWDFGDGTYSTVANPSHNYPFCDTSYYVRLLMYLTNGDSCGYEEYVYVWCDSIWGNICQAWFVAAQDATNNMQFSFTDLSVYSPVSWSWDFGDGSNSSAQNPTHTYTTPGVYNVCLVSLDANGCSSVYCSAVNAGNVQVQDMTASLYHYSTVTPGFPLWVALDYFNNGTISMSGTVEYRYPAGTTFVSASPTPATHDAANRLLTWNYNNLLPYQSGFIAVDLSASVSLPLGSFAHDTLWVNPLSGDLHPANNMSAVADEVVGSWDPNDKAASPKGVGATGDIPMNTPEISYLVRFQNTGTAPAVNVAVSDIIDDNFDLTTVQVTNASHAHRTEIIGNQLLVSFDNIYLPDSASNEPASHGYFVVKARLKPGIAPNTSIYNTAAIYFDFNDPVLTNTTVNTLRNAVSISEEYMLQLTLLPNPANNRVAMLGDWQHEVRYRICHATGQQVLDGTAIGKLIEINTALLPTGLYTVTVSDGRQTTTRKLLIAR